MGVGNTRFSASIRRMEYGASINFTSRTKPQITENIAENLLNHNSDVVLSTTLLKRGPADGNLAIIDDTCQPFTYIPSVFGKVPRKNRQNNCHRKPVKTSNFKKRRKNSAYTFPTKARSFLASITRGSALLKPLREALLTDPSVVAMKCVSPCNGKLSPLPLLNQRSGGPMI